MRATVEGRLAQHQKSPSTVDKTGNAMEIIILMLHAILMKMPALNADKLFAMRSHQSPKLIIPSTATTTIAMGRALALAINGAISSRLTVRTIVEGRLAQQLELAFIVGRMTNAMAQITQIASAIPMRKNALNAVKVQHFATNICEKCINDQHHFYYQTNKF